ncbi:hypothetical protein CERSUDRAFT_148466 [Gelatoporia subvermispora B]|uniref:Nucleoside transporter n=1 Tax=Ceriporiopsis subvermispora (strain B) TaxID=914234 RepID=M2RPU2_CERS8|nr:hypothetical protein CERSUDRAFT_148466 [Gelatoporia subvermispora B]
MSGHRRYSSSHNSPEALYHPIPQAPVASNAVLTRTSLDVPLSDEETELVENITSSVEISQDETRIRVIHFILGCAVLLPWNALITATPYFMSRLAGSSIQSSFSSYLSTTFTAANLGFLAHATATSKQASNTRRVLFSISWLTLLSFLLTLSTYIHAPAALFSAFVLLNGIAQAAAGSYLQTAVVAIASLFGPRTMQAVMSGQAAVGVAVSAVQVISAATSLNGPAPSMSPAIEARDASEPEETSAFIFFALSTLFLLVAAGAYCMLVRLPMYKYVVERSQMAGGHTPGMPGQLDDAETDFEPHQRARHDGKSDMVRLAKLNLPYNVAVACVFAITLSVFPPLTVSVRPTNPATHPLLFSVVHFLIFNVGDFLGRYLCSFPRLLVWSARRLLTLSLARTLFVPLFLMCNIQWGASSLPTNPIISSDVLFMTILLAFGLSNGYVSSMCMMSAPSLTHNPRLKGHAQDVDIAATVASFCLVGGLALGSLASFAVRAAVCNCNPFKW